MFKLLNPYILYIKYAVIAIALGACFFVYKGYSDTYNENLSLKETILKEKIKYTILKEDLEVVNAENERQEELYSSWKKQKPIIKYKTVYKYKKEIKNATCQEKVKQLSTIDFNSL